MPARRHEKIKILVLAANPRGTDELRLGQEAHDIREALGDADIACDTRSAVRTREIPHALRTFRPNFVHFSGHGERGTGIVLEGTTGNADFVPKQALAELFRIFKDVKCVVFNNCYSREQAEVVAEHVPYVIGMRQEISDDAAIEFSFGFYQAIRDGEDVEKAFEWGRLAVGFSYEIASEFAVPVLFHDGHEYLVPRKRPLVEPGVQLSGSPPSASAVAAALSWAGFETSSLRLLQSIYGDARLEFSRAIEHGQTNESEAAYVVGVSAREGNGGRSDLPGLPGRATRSLANPFRLWVEVQQQPVSLGAPHRLCRNLVRAVNEEAAKLIFLTNATLPKAQQDEIERFAHRMRLDYCVLDGSRLPGLLASLDTRGKLEAAPASRSDPSPAALPTPQVQEQTLELSLSCGFTLDPVSAGFEGATLSGEPGNPVFVAADVEVLSCTGPAPVTLSAELREPDVGDLLAYETHGANSLRPALSQIPLATGDRRRYTFILFPRRPAVISTSEILFRLSSGEVAPTVRYRGEGAYHVRNVRMADWIPQSRATLLASLERQLEHWQASSDTANHLLVAPAGTGKSHAVARLRRCWLSRGAIELPLDGQIHNSDLSVIKCVLAHAFSLEPRALGEDQTESVATWLAYAGVPKARAREIAMVIGSDAGLEAADANLFVDALVALLRRLSAAAPVVLLFEDAHKARPSALVLLREIQRRLRNAPVALFVTSRHEPESADLAEQKSWYQALQELLPAFSQTALTALRHDEGIELIQRTIPTVEAHDAEAILDQVGTSPFGIREAINYLIDYGIAVHDPNLNEYRIERRETLRSAVRLEHFTQATQLRLRRLRERSPQWLGAFLETASLLGRHFPVQPCLRAVDASLENEVPRYLGECERLQFLKASHSQADFLSFDHDLVRTAILQDISATQQRLLAGKLLPEVDTADDFVVGSLAYQAGLAEKSAAHLTRYAEQNAARSRHLDAIRALRVAIRIFDPKLTVGRGSATLQEFSGAVDQALRQAPLIQIETSTPGERYAKLLHLLRLLLVSLSDVAGGGEPTIEPILAESFLLARRIMDEAALADLEFYEARWLFARGRLQDAVERHQQAEAHYASLNRLDLLDKRIGNLLRLAVSYRQIGDRQRSLQLLEQVGAVTAPDDLKVKARTLAEIGALYFYTDAAEVRRYWDQTLVAARASEHPSSIMHALTDLAQLDVIDSELNTAQSRLQESLRIAERYGIESEYIRILLLNGCIALMRGELAAAKRDLLEAEEIASRGGNHRRLWRIRANLATVYELSGDLRKSYARDREVCESVTPLILEALPAVRKGLHFGREFLGVANIGLRAERSELHRRLKDDIEPSILAATDPLLTAVIARDLGSAPSLLGRHCKRLADGLLRYVITE